MNAIHEFPSTLTLGAAVTSGPLTMVPLTKRAPARTSYLTLSEALEQKSLRVSELSESGSVPEVRVENEGDLPVLLLDGEALIGAKQNRVLNLTVLVAARATTKIPVSCVEAGRWRHESRQFSDGDAIHFASARAAKLAGVSLNMERGNSKSSDQAEVWRIMEGYLHELGASAPSMAMQDIFESVRVPVDEMVRAMARVPEQCGAGFIVAGRLLGLDVLSAPGAYSRLHDKLVRSYAVDAQLDNRSARRPELTKKHPHAAVHRLFAQLLESRWTRHAAVGLGEDLRARGFRLNAGALVHEDEVIHLVAFPKHAEERVGDPWNEVRPMPRRSHG